MYTTRIRFFFLTILLITLLVTNASLAQLSINRIYNQVSTTTVWSGESRYGQYCYVGGSFAGWFVYDIHNPEQISRVVTVPNIEAGETVFYGNYAIFRICSQGIQVEDISDPANPVQVSRLDTPGFTEDISNKGPLIAVADRTGGLRLISVIDPEAPVEISSLAVGNAYGVTVDGQMAYVTTTNSLKVVNIANPASPYVVSTLELNSLGRRVAKYGIYVYIANYDAGLTIVDVSTPSEPTVVATWQGPQYTGELHDVTVDRDIAYLAYGMEGIYALDVSEPTSPVQIGHCSNSHAVGISYREGYLYCGDYDRGFSIFSVEDGYSTSVSEITPDAYMITPFFPNPFNSSTSIKVRLTKNESVQLKIYDSLGRLVAVPVSGTLGTGVHSINWDATDFPSGTYLYRLQVHDMNKSGKLQLVK